MRVLCINSWNLITAIFGIELEKKMLPQKINNMWKILNPHRIMGTLYSFICYSYLHSLMNLVYELQLQTLESC